MVAQMLLQRSHITSSEAELVDGVLTRSFHEITILAWQVVAA